MNTVEQNRPSGMHTGSHGKRSLNRAKSIAALRPERPLAGCSRTTALRQKTGCQAKKLSPLCYVTHAARSCYVECVQRYPTAAAKLHPVKFDGRYSGVIGE
jgi:hypothetical protein